MKVRVGYGLGTRSVTNDAERFSLLVDSLEALRFDSLWLSEKITDACPDPIVAMAFAAARTSRLKFGTSVLVLPGRNPMLLAKELATLDRLSDGRLLPAFGLGQVDPGEQQAFGVDRKERAKRFDEMLPLLRRFWSEDTVDHDGTFFQYDGARVRPAPVQDPIEIWFGGIAPSELRRTGRLGDGWLPSFCTPDDVRSGRAEIERVAAEHDRAIDPEHFGALVPYGVDGVPDTVAAFLKSRRPDVDPADVVAGDLPALKAQLERFVDAGASKFVVVPFVEPDRWDDHLAEVADVLMPLQN
ncbi:TIGR03619 family F420-dependent LLM class oxidoreductase [Actinospongicola halichondriae]|uniref:TIGR03619 family F420-dependent LLM class oxidoreductase n=1 Tax=Actinospongicola halichondriae TaxID=3236844 RepID=UPI003D4BB4F3